MCASPYLSVVVTTRNDNHGGDLDRRTQIFIDALAAQAERFRVPMELVVVEWNPPADRAPLASALRWPLDNEWIEVRIITVPPSVHSRFRYSDKLPMFQMIAKNVGVRRARGEFVLATNIDVLFSDPLFQWFASRSLEKSVLYRSDRVDVAREVPVGEPVEIQLEYCRRNVLRVCRKDGMWLVPSDSASHTLEDTTLSAAEVCQRLRRPEVSRPNGGAIARLYRALRRRMTGEVHGQRRNKIVGWQVLRLTWILAKTAIKPFGFLRKVPLVRLLTVEIPAARRRLRDFGYRPSLEELLDELTTARRRVPELHTMACGDFTLMDQGAWFAIRGSPELEMFSMHLDSLTLITAYRSGMPVRELPPDHVHYHIEHGGGWTPEQADALYRTMNQRGIRILLYPSFRRIATHLLEDKAYHLSSSDWGLALEQLPETVVTRRVVGRRIRAVS